MAERQQGRPLHPGFIGLDDRVEQRYRDQEQKLAALRTQGQLLRAHSQFVREGAPTDHAARYAVEQHARHTGVKYTPGYGSARNTMASDANPRRPAIAAAAGTSRAPVPSTSAPRPHLGSRELHQKCDVMNCEIEFSSIGKFVEHTKVHNHSPCHPTRQLTDGRLDNDAPDYCCTTCGNLYKTADICLTHMEETGHDHLQEPVPVAGFMCLQCFVVFLTNADCRLHQHATGHFGYGHALPDDVGRPEPQFLPAPVYKLFRRACRKVASTVECLNCSITLQDSESMNVHIDQHHSIMAMTEKSLADVWPTLMCKYTCVQCQRLYNKLPPEGLGAIHHCSPTMAGIIVETDVKSTYEFILRRSLSHISLVAGDDDDPLNTREEVPGRNEALETNGGGAEGGAVNDDDDNDSLIIEEEGDVVVDDDNDSLILEEDHIVLLDDSIKVTGVARPHTMDRIDSIELIENEQQGSSRGKDRGTLQVPPRSPRRSLSIEIIDNPCSAPLRQKALGEESDSDDDDWMPLRDAVREKSDTRLTRSLKKQQTNMAVRDRRMAERQSPAFAVASTSKDAGRCKVCTSTLWQNPKDPSKPPRCTCGGNDQQTDGFSANKTSPASSNSSGATAKTPSPPAAVLVTIPGSSGKRKREVNIQQSTNSQKKRKETPSPVTPENSLARRKNKAKRRSPRLAKTTDTSSSDQAKNKEVPTANRPMAATPEYIPLGGTSKQANTSQLSNSLRPKVNKPKTTPPSASNQTKSPSSPNRPKTNIPQNTTASASNRTSLLSKSNESKKPRSNTPQNNPPSASNRPQNNQLRAFNRPQNNPPSVSNRLQNNQLGASNRLQNNPPTAANRPQNNQAGASNMPPNSPSQSRGPPILSNLDKMRYIIFVDFDNWMGFFQRLLQPLPDGVFVWGFYGGNGQWKSPVCASFRAVVARKCFYLNPKCGNRKDAADFAICVNVGRMDDRLPTHIPFTILSGDKGFEEVERQMASSTRRVRVINPHHQQVDELYTLLVSMMDA